MRLGEAQSISEAEELVQNPHPEIDQDAVVVDQSGNDISPEIQELYRQHDESIPEPDAWCYILFSSQLLADTVAKQLHFRRGNPKLTDKRLPILFAPFNKLEVMTKLQSIDE